MFVDIEVQSMQYFSEQMKGIYLRNVTKKISNHDLKWRNKQARSMMKSLKYTNENVAHEMRTPLGSIFVLINILLTLSRSYRDYQRARVFYR